MSWVLRNYRCRTWCGWSVEDRSTLRVGVGRWPVDPTAAGVCVKCFVTPCHAMPCHTMPYHAIPYHAMLPCVGRKGCCSRVLVLPVFLLLYF